MKSEDMLKKSCLKLGIPYIPPLPGASTAQDNERIKLLRRQIADQRGKLLCTAKLTDRLHKRRQSRQVMRERVMPGMHQLIQNMQQQHQNMQQQHQNMQYHHHHHQQQQAQQHQEQAIAGLLPFHTSSLRASYPPILPDPFAQNPRASLKMVPSTNTSVSSPKPEAKPRNDETSKVSAEALRIMKKTRDEAASYPSHQGQYVYSNRAHYPSEDANRFPGLSLLGSALNSDPRTVGGFLRSYPTFSERHMHSQRSEIPSIDAGEALKMSQNIAPPKKRLKVTPAGKSSSDGGSSSEDSLTRARS